MPTAFTSNNDLLTGTASCEVDFGNSTISAFNLDVSNGESGSSLRQVTFAGGSGNITGSMTYNITGLDGEIDSGHHDPQRIQVRGQGRILRRRPFHGRKLAGHFR